MPSTSKKQHNFMAAIANNPSFAKKVGIPQSVGKDFSSADKGRKFEKGGATMMGKKIPNAMADMMARRRPRMGAGMPPPAPPVMPPQPPAPMGMKKGGKVRRFEEGGLSQAAEKWLGGADRTDPHILERMKSAVPDWKTGPQQDPAPVEDRTPTPVAQYAPKVEGRDTYGNDSPDGDVGGGRTTDFKAIPKAVSQAVSQAAPKATPQAAPSKPRSLASGVNQGDVRRSEPKDGSSFGSKSNQGDIRAYDNAQSAKRETDAAELYRESNRPNSKPKDEPSKPRSLASGVNQGDVRRSEPKPEPKSETNAGAVTGRVSPLSKRMVSPEQKAENDVSFATELGLSALGGVAGTGLRGLRALRAMRYGAAEPKLLTGPANVKRLAAPPKQITKGTAAERKAAAEDAVYDARRASDMEAMHKKGGAVKKYAKGGMAHGGMHKMPNGKMMKNSAMNKGGMPMKDGKPAFMKKFNKGGLTDDNYRQTRQKEIAEKADARAANIKNKEDVVSKRAYNHAVRMYENELKLDPKDTNPVGYAMRKFEDSVGDKMRSVGKFFGSNRVTSQDDAAQMQAREDVKGYRKGGMPMKDGKPAFMMGKKKMMGGGMAKYAKGGGIESRGKTKGTVIRMAAGGSVSSASRRADGIAQRGKTRG